MIFSVTILDWWVDPQETTKFTQCSWKESNHCCCSTNKASYWMKCRLYTHILSVTCLVMLTFQPDIVNIGFLDISCGIPSMTFAVMNRTKVNFYWRSQYTNSSILQRMVGRVWLWFLFLTWLSWDQRASETSQFVTNKMAIRGLHSAQGHCYLQYSQLYSAAFEMTNWIENVFTAIMFVQIWCRRTDLCRRQPL